MKKKYTEKELQEKIQEALKQQEEKIKLEQRFEFIANNLRDETDRNWRKFDNLESAIYRLTERIEKLEGKKEKQHKILHS